MIDMDIRPLEQTDLVEVAALAAAAENEGFRFLTRFVTEAAARTVSLNSAIEFFVCVHDSGSIIAVGGVTRDPYVAVDGVGRLRHLYVAEPERRRGVGRALVASLEARASAAYAVLRLRTDTAEAARFYEELGYSRVIDATATHSRNLPHYKGE
jgi:GNAT superfamily N-acetyltransferase